MTEVEFRLWCRKIATDVARHRLHPDKIHVYLSRHPQLNKILGIKPDKSLSRKGALKLFGLERCDQIMDEELASTGVYKKNLAWEFVNAEEHQKTASGATNRGTNG